MTTATETTLRIFQGTADASDDGWANDAYYTLTRGGVAAREGVDNCSSWDECSGREDGEEYVTMRVGDAEAARVLLTEAGYRVAA